MSVKTNEKSILNNKTRKVKYKITSTKNLKNRTVKMNDSLYNTMLNYKSYLTENNLFDTKNFIFGNNRFLAQTNIDNNKAKYFKLAGIKEITIHEFRHSHVSLMVNEYLKMNETDTTKFFILMSNRMGHTIQVMQETYMHLFPDVQDTIVNLLNNL